MKDTANGNGLRATSLIPVPGLDISTLDRYIESSGVKELTRDLQELRARIKPPHEADVSPPGKDGGGRTSS